MDGGNKKHKYELDKCITIIYIISLCQGWNTCIVNAEYSWLYNFKGFWIIVCLLSRCIRIFDTNSAKNSPLPFYKIIEIALKQKINILVKVHYSIIVISSVLQLKLKVNKRNMQKWK